MFQIEPYSNIWCYKPLDLCYEEKIQHIKYTIHKESKTILLRNEGKTFRNYLEHYKLMQSIPCIIYEFDLV